jgi:hypothetical protein
MELSGIDDCHLLQATADQNAQLSLGVYPFMFGSAKDFEPVFEEMVKVRRSTVARFCFHCQPLTLCRKT